MTGKFFKPLYFDVSLELLKLMSMNQMFELMANYFMKMMK